MAVSVFDLFKIGIGPSSSHTVGPMKAACSFARRLEREGLLGATRRIRVSLFGSLAHTGRGHGTDKAVMLGLQGELPDRVDPDVIEPSIATIRESGRLSLLGSQPIEFREKTDLLFRKREKLPHHPNGMRFEALDGHGEILERREYYSVGGGFVINQDKASEDLIVADSTPIPYPFDTADELLALCERHRLRIVEIMLGNESSWRPGAEIRRRLLAIRLAMRQCMERGYAQQGVLPGGLRVSRRAPSLYRELSRDRHGSDGLSTLDWVNLYALAVNEENAAGGKVVTSPTNGAAGVAPAQSVVPNFMCQTGDPNGRQCVDRRAAAADSPGARTGDGSGGESIYGPTFPVRRQPSCCRRRRRACRRRLLPAGYGAPFRGPVPHRQKRGASRHLCRR